RGSYQSLSISISCPGNLKNTKNNTAIMCTLISRPFFCWMAGFSDNTFRSFFPEMYEDYATILDALCADNPHLHRNFIECVWAAATINFGPSAYTDCHMDFLNLVRGMCTLWALSNFNTKKGGHIIVWDLNPIIELSLGSCILLPSTLLEHSNLPIQEGEHCCSFIMYSVAGLFHWVENGMMSDSEFLQGGEEQEHIWKEQHATLPLKNIHLFTIWKDLLQQWTEELQSQQQV
ncbi:hypothetical protein ARMGADRAFT_945249, partial [Armillaria gallica]